MASNKPWKVFERFVAKHFKKLGYPDAKRTGPKQGMQDEDMDVEGVDEFYIECKYGYPWVISKAAEILTEQEKIAGKVNTLKVLVRHSKREYFIIHSSDLEKIQNNPSRELRIFNVAWNSWKADAWYSKGLRLKVEEDEVILCAREKGMIGYYAMMDEKAWMRWIGK